MRSDIVKKGATRCAHRSLFHANGYGEEDLKKPLIGICNSFNEIIPGHIHLREIAEAAKLGVAAAGGTPLEFPAIGVCDGIAMGHTGMKYSLASRELIADSIEAVAMASGFDALVLIPNCDKVVPGAHGGGAAQYPGGRRLRRPDAPRPFPWPRREREPGVRGGR